MIEVDLDPFGLSSRHPPGVGGWVPPLALEPVRSPIWGVRQRARMTPEERSQSTRVYS